MKKPSLLDDYFAKYAADDAWGIQSADTGEGIRKVIVIPAYAENEVLFSTLATLARNPASELEATFVLCVINNKPDASDAVRENNFQTMCRLDRLIDKKASLKEHDEKSLREIHISPLKVGYVDASSAGREIPQNEGGVGMARKIGMDRALGLLREWIDRQALILSLDADTRVEPNYLQAIGEAFKKRMKTAVVAYEHDMPTDRQSRRAIVCYEIFLRYWVLGLTYALSPYAYHAVGSTIVTTASAYLEVRGMNRRAAGEDFYFLNKLAKQGTIGQINTTRVHPSARISHRVPFGTGAAMGDSLAGQREPKLLYDPRVFVILAEWLTLMNTHSHEDAQTILAKAGNIHPRLAAFLTERRFIPVWTRIAQNAKTKKTLRDQFHTWFDGFETLKLINDLTRTVYPRIDLFDASEKLLAKMTETPADFVSGSPNEDDALLRLLNDLRAKA